jgi:hypothetical protein
MSDTGEQGMNPKDPAQRAGIGGGVVPDDKTEGEEEAAELEHSKTSQRTTTQDHTSMPAANQMKAEPIPVSQHESSPPSATVDGDDLQAPTKPVPDGSGKTTEDHPKQS